MKNSKSNNFLFFSKKIKKEIMFVFSNIINNGIPSQIQQLVDNKVIEISLNCLEEFTDGKTILNILEGLYSLLKKGESPKTDNPYLKILEDCQGVGRLEALQSHPSKAVFKRVTEILEHFFEYTEEA